MSRSVSLWLLFLVGLAGCSNSRQDSGTAGAAASQDVPIPINVAATVGMVADVVRQFGGDRVTVTQVCGSGVDPHLYIATRDDVQTMIIADMIYYSGP
ncbi:metal ABC transporter solute-binding protein, Zn/Mn family [Novipirellula rosea]